MWRQSINVSLSTCELRSCSLACGMWLLLRQLRCSHLQCPWSCTTHCNLPTGSSFIKAEKQQDGCCTMSHMMQHGMSGCHYLLWVSTDAASERKPNTSAVNASVKAKCNPWAWEGKESPTTLQLPQIRYSFPHYRLSQDLLDLGACLVMKSKCRVLQSLGKEAKTSTVGHTWSARCMARNRVVIRILMQQTLPHVVCFTTWEDEQTSRLPLSVAALRGAVHCQRTPSGSAPNIAVSTLVMGSTPPVNPHLLLGGFYNVQNSFGQRSLTFLLWLGYEIILWAFLKPVCCNPTSTQKQTVPQYYSMSMRSEDEERGMCYVWVGLSNRLLAQQCDWKKCRAQGWRERQWESLTRREKHKGTQTHAECCPSEELLGQQHLPP